jgi:hypothetical protein
MHQHVAHRSSFGTLRDLLKDYLGLCVHPVEFLLFKSLLARYYRPTYRSLLGKILAGNLLHIDETEVTLRTGKGYVWVFANLEEVVFLYKPTREGEFLRGLLKDFKGVLVSDFYAAYNALDCPQQKCLIHLMRDINQDLLNNPFDEELRSVTGPFGSLLREIVATIDKHGLKRNRLQRYDRAVGQYFSWLSRQSFQSEAAEGLRKRLTKYQGKLFTFLRHDGVPWNNNNNAENAIKRFAYYREGTVGVMSEEGLQNYLVLLSLCQTCRYKGLGFLKFLLSRARDKDAFAAMPRRKRRSAAVELYPKGFVPPHLLRIEKLRSRQKAADPSDEALEEEMKDQQAQAAEGTEQTKQGP